MADWRAVRPRPVAVDKLRTDPALQPRAMECVGFAQANAEERRSQDHIAVMAARLRDTSAAMEPVLAIRTDAGLYVLDGHHRLEAYRLAKRGTIAARILSADWATAVAASKLVNLGGEKMAMHQSQRADAAWQLLAQVTQHGQRNMPEGTSQRAIAGRFGIALGTVSGMVGRLRERSIDPEAFEPDHRDPGTGWPRWQYARQKNYGAEWSPPSQEEQVTRAAANVARVVAEAHEKYGIDALRRATCAMRDRGMDAAAVREWEEFLGEIDPDDDSDF